MITQPYKEIKLPLNGGGDGYLIALEQMSSMVPFEIKRVYYIFSVKETLRRGFHAHKKLKQLLVCVSGKCEILLDDGIGRSTIQVDSPSKGLLIEKPVWREMFNFSKDCVLLVLASELYREDDYIKSYTEFRSYLRCIDD